MAPEMMVRDWQPEGALGAEAASSSTEWWLGSEQRGVAESLLMAALRDADAAKAASSAMLAFLGRMSHEMRTPLNVIFGYVDLLDMEVHGPVTAKQRADLGCIRESEGQLLIMIDDLLDFLKIQSGQVTHRSVDVPMPGLLTSAITLMEPLVKEKGLRIGGVTCGPDVTVRADPDRTRQILLNLLTNAIKFTAPDGEVRIECDATEDVVHIRVSDTGAGIAMDQDEDQVRGYGDPEQIRYSLWPDSVDEGDRRRTFVARHRHDRRSGSPHPRQVSHRGEPD